MLDQPFDESFKDYYYNPPVTVTSLMDVDLVVPKGMMQASGLQLA